MRCSKVEYECISALHKHNRSAAFTSMVLIYQHQIKFYELDAEKNVKR